MCAIQSDGIGFWRMMIANEEQYAHNSYMINNEH